MQRGWTDCELSLLRGGDQMIRILVVELYGFWFLRRIRKTVRVSCHQKAIFYTLSLEGYQRLIIVAIQHGLMQYLRHYFESKQMKQLAEL